VRATLPAKFFNRIKSSCFSVLEWVVSWTLPTEGADHLKIFGK